MIKKSDILVIDSHSGAHHYNHGNLHWLNAKRIADRLGADFIWDYANVNDHIQSDYKTIIMVHCSGYAKLATEWITNSPKAKIFYVSNEFNLGEPLYLWSAIKSGKVKDYEVIANHPKEASKITKLYVSKWHNVNLNALCIGKPPKKSSAIDLFEGDDDDEKLPHCIYYGSYRKGREKYFKKYLVDSPVILSTQKKNIEKFQEIGVDSRIIGRMNWNSGALSNYSASLYIEDEKTHKHYNHLANRFYEALKNEVVPLFDKSCMGSIEKSGYAIPTDYYVDSPADIVERIGKLESLSNLIDQAIQEKEDVLKAIEKILD